MKTIQLTRGKQAIVDDENYEFLSQWKWCAHQGGRGIWYAVRYENGPIFMHGVVLGISPPHQADHRNHDGLDNRTENLRVCTRTQNQQNRRGWGGTSEFKGVYWDSRRHGWRTQIVVNKRKITRLFRGNEIAAARYYDQLASTHFGEFAVLNFLEAADAGHLCI